jgi:formate C-acetyltransferase
MIGGLSNVGSLEGELNLAALLEQTLAAGPAVLADEATLLAALKATIAAATEAFVAEHDAALRRRFERGDPKLYRTLFTRDCVRRRRGFEAGGARYNWAVVSYQGIANLIDSLAAIRAVLFGPAAVGAEELLAALKADFEGFESLRQRLAAAPKFGNDDPRADQPGCEIVAYAWDCLLAHRTPRGGRYLPSCILFATYADAGAPVGALPDGRRAGQPLTDSVGPVAGRDTHGPTAMLNSVLKLPLARAAGTPVLNLRFSRDLFHSAAGLAAAAGLVRGFFAQGGMQIQVSVLDGETLRAAQRQPEQYGDLLVRIGGYSEYFTRLSPALQDSVLARTEQTV